MSLLNWFSCALLLFTIAAHTAELEATVVNIEGEEQPVKILELTLDGVRTATGDVPYKDISEIRVASVSDTPAKQIIHLQNGDTLRAAIKSGDDAKLTVSSEVIGEQQIQFKFLRAVVFPLKDGLAGSAIDDFLAAPPPKEDLLLMQKGETVRGVYEKFSETEITFNTGGQSRAYTFDKVAAFRLAPLEEFKLTKDFRGTIVFRDGSRLTGKLQNLKAGKLSFEAVTGEAWTLDTVQLGSVVFEGGKLVQLSALKPANVEERAYIGGTTFIHKWKKDLSADGQALKIGSKEYSRGIGMHSYAKLRFDLGGQYARFLCDVGLAAHAPAGSNVDWKVLVDGKVAASGTAQGGGQPQPVKIELNGAKQIELLCDFGADQDDAGDLLNFASARLIRQ